MKRFLFWFAIAVFVVSNICFWIPPSKLFQSLGGLTTALSFLYVLHRFNQSVEAKIAAAVERASVPIPQPDYTPKLFGVPMEWDPESGFWWASYGSIDVDLGQNERGLGFTWHIGSLSATGVETLTEAKRQLEAELTRIREAIPSSEAS